jgi:hypothetical protein
MILGIQRSCKEGEQRTLAFSMFFAMLCLGYFAGGPFTDYIREQFKGGKKKG